MAAFRRCVIALAVLAVFAGLASAQGTFPMTCSISGNNTTMRGEAKLEKTGDVLLLCTGGSAIADDTVVKRFDFQVTLSTTVKSRIVKAANSVSEALLLIDEPGTGGSLSPGFGPDQVVTPCTTNGATGDGCSATPIYKESKNGYTVMSDQQTAGGHVGAANTFQGVASGNSVTFYGVPVLAPVSTGVARVYRITNLYADASTVASGGTVTASMSVSGTGSSTVITVPSSTVTIGTTSSGLDATGTTASAQSATVCVDTPTDTTKAALIGTISFKEGFTTAFKTRQIANNTVANALTNSLALQNIPGLDVTSSESGFVLASAETGGTAGAIAGLADFGTRLKATFTNIPTGAHIFVSTTNIINGVAAAVTGGGIGNSATNSYAELVATNALLEATVDGANGPAAIANSRTGTDGVLVTDVTNTLAAIWEVTNADKGAVETFTFNVYIEYTAASNVPVTGASLPSVTLSYAPTASTTSSPRFTAGTITKTAFTLGSCRTILLFPFVTSSAGFDTGLAISNTSTDPFRSASNAVTTSAQAGTCTLNWYPSGPETAGVTTTVGTAITPTATAIIVSGSVWAHDTSEFVANFTGYMVAVCNFQYAHGFGFISQAGQPYNGTMGYLATVIPDPGSGTRSSGRYFKTDTQTITDVSGEALNN